MNSYTWSIISTIHIDIQSVVLTHGEKFVICHLLRQYMLDCQKY
jgi:hypothetical protein